MTVGTSLVITASIVERARRLVCARAEAKRDEGSSEIVAKLTAYNAFIGRGNSNTNS